ncbi:hypothetical protein RF11_15455 [Thelohanellus kitauei]|uniref:Uncharacterized protein n=1 Tax=Thelohanellus kitauei TaxID=669202 RepID=A0A0C2J1F1_THEKT|nr:hypothetical protein RF11_15455 [Thelohanellus kitauei]
MTRLVQRTPRDANTPLSSPNSLSSIGLPIKNTLSHRSEQFLQYDSGPDENRILIFSIQNNLELLRSSDCWCCDETFKTAPIIVFSTLRGTLQNKQYRSSESLWIITCQV